VDQREAVIGAWIHQREAKAGRQRGVAHAAKERIIQIQEAVAHALGEAVRAVATALQGEELS